MGVPTFLDRYPAKMISRLAERLVVSYKPQRGRLLDPFCGSGAVLMAAHRNGIPSVGIDINPYAWLLSKVKTEGFDVNKADRLLAILTAVFSESGVSDRMNWDNKAYWFTPRTLAKLERLRALISELDMVSTAEGRAILLSVTLSIRRCSRADQRSPKPFISKAASEVRARRHFDPLRELTYIYQRLRCLHGGARESIAEILVSDIVRDDTSLMDVGSVSCIITSPPYINAQDYYRNFKLEFFFLEGLLPFRVTRIKDKFIGTDRGDLLAGIDDKCLHNNRILWKRLGQMEGSHPRLAAVIHRYLNDMTVALKRINDSLARGGHFVMVCGDNLIGGYQVPTWRILNKILESNGLSLRQSFGDTIVCRNVPPQRCGHKGLIKRETISIFTKP